MCVIRLINKRLYLKCSSLTKEYNISENTIKKWCKRDICNRLYFDNYAYVLYDSIPAPSRSKLPTRETLVRLYEDSRIDALTQKYFQEMEYAQNTNFVKYMDLYREAGVKFDDLTAFAKKHAVWEVVLSYYSEDGLVHDLYELHKAYCMLYPGHYVYHAMCGAIKRACENGIKSILIRKQGQGRKKEFDAVIDCWIMQALSSGKKYGKRKIFKLVSELCRESGRKAPSESTIHNRIGELKPLVNEFRSGKDPHFYKRLPYQGIEKAQHPNGEWQVDGWRLPFYMKGFETLTIFWVLDVCTGKVLGYHISRSENTETILKGLENAVTDTGYLPFEIVSDNHSFNKTKEAEYFKTTLEKLGCTWTVSSNPRRKSSVERSFKVFGEQFCKDEYGYIGEGILTKNPNGRPSQELMDKYTKENGWLTEDQIKLVAIKLVEDFNNRTDKEGKTPVMKYREHKPEGCNIKVDKLDCLRLFVRESEHTVRRGQINIERAGITYEFHLNKEQYLSLNDIKVRVRYSDFDEIYLFDIETDEPLGSVPRKQYAHGALADQTEEDTQKYFKHKGRLNGIQTGFKNRRIEILERAESIDPEAAYRMNAKLTPKDVVEAYKTDGRLRELAARQGVDPDNVPSIPVFCESNIEDLATERIKKDKRRRGPVVATQEEVDNFNINSYLLDN